MSNYLIPSLLSILSLSFVFGFITLRSSVSSANARVDSMKTVLSEKPVTKEDAEPIYFFNAVIPESLSLCGERVPLNDIDVVEKFERDFLVNVNDRTQMTMYLKRAGRFFPYIESRLKAAGLPDDLKYLAVAESGLLDLRSPAGAAGVWQIMPETGRQFGLIVNTDVDERYNLERATDVSIRYFQNAYQKFGNWAMVAASYNMGIGGASDEQNFQDVKNYFALWLNRETARYVFRILAIKEVMKNPAKYGYGRVIPYKPIETKETVVKKSVPNLAQWAKEQGTSFKAVKYLNPWLRSRELPAPPAKGFKLLLPKSSGDFVPADTAKYSYIDLLNGKDTEKTDDQRYHTVRDGETVESICNRIGLVPSELRKINRLAEGEEIKVGQRLKITP
jgi:membrane-bound lytic murein transglycosylase D